MMTDSVKKGEETPSFKGRLFHYCENTGVYTLRQIVEPTRCQVRRVYWIAVFITGCIMFSVQTYESTLRFLEKETSISMKINYNNSIRFPAVVICNQNAFKASKVVEMGLYKEVSALYTEQKLFSSPTKLRQRELKLANMTLNELYKAAAHNLSDMIAHCTWDEKECSPYDFTPILTDFGICYVFNMAGPGNPVKQSSMAGSQHALSLYINIEQYEYMAGPNEGAGVRVYLHDQRKYIPMQDRSQPVPPGAHALVAGQITLIENLKEPYGKCVEGLPLEFHTQFTKYSCHIDCYQQHLAESCGCREFYMPPSINNQDYPPLCTVYQHFNCVNPFRDNFIQIWPEKCVCPISCKYTSVETTISYGSTSNFDMDKMLSGNISNLQANYLNAREINQRVNDYKVASDEVIVSAVESVVARIDDMYDLIEQRLEETVHGLHEAIEEIETRAEFHAGRAMNEVQYMIEYNFKRIWRVYSDRVFNHVTSDYFSLGDSAKRILSRIASSANTTNPADVFQREYKWLVVENELLNKAGLISRAVNYLLKVNHSYTTATPLGNYKATQDGIYDASFLNLELFTPTHEVLHKYVSELLKHMRQALGYIRTIRNIGELCVYNMTCEYESLDKIVADFEYRCRRYNYYIFLMNDRVIGNPLELIDLRINHFTHLNMKMEETHYALENILTRTTDVLTKARSGFWMNIRNFSKDARAYMQNNTLRKTDLAIMAGSKLLTQSIHTSTQLLQELQGRGQEFTDGFHRVYTSVMAVYVSMVDEYTTKKFYTRLHAELTEVIGNNSKAAYYMPLFEHLLRHSVNITNYLQLIPLLNVDFIHFNSTVLETRMSNQFETLQENSNIGIMMGDVADEFEAAVTNLRSNLAEYLEVNQIDTAFFRENFSKMDIFLSELSYTEIKQQIAYDITNLIGDIGGSAGLFVGASLVTLFEILDILWYGACLIKNKLMSKSKQPKNHQPKSASHVNGNEVANNCPSLNEIYWIRYNENSFSTKSGELRKTGGRMSKL